MPRAGTLLAAFLMATPLGAAGALAQTMTNPGTKPAASSPTTEKLHAHEDETACAGYGAGFVRLPGSDTCIKIGGGVTTEATGSGR